MKKGQNNNYEKKFFNDNEKHYNFMHNPFKEVDDNKKAKHLKRKKRKK
jgi:hypothetical protein